MLRSTRVRPEIAMTTGLITYSELVALYGEGLAFAYLRVIERHAPNAASAQIIPFDRNIRLQRALNALAA